MSYLARLKARSRFGGGIPAVMPKGLIVRQGVPVLRDAEQEPQQDAPLAAIPTGPLRRAPEENDHEDDEMRRAPGADESEAQRVACRATTGPLRREEEMKEEELATLRRAEADEMPEEDAPEEISPLRRMNAAPPGLVRRAEDEPPEGNEEIAPLRRSRFAHAPTERGLAGASQPPAMHAPDHDLGAVPPRGSPPAGVNGTASGALPAISDHRVVPDFLSTPVTEDRSFDVFDAPTVHSSRSRANETPPQVFIDQIDVLIHEPAAPAPRSGARFDQSRALRARYLRRL